MTRLRRLVALGVVLVLTGLLVPDPSLRPGAVRLLALATAEGVGRDRDVVWVLALGSDARRGEDVLRSRADAIQLVGLNLRTGDGAVLGIPRDSYVTIPGYGSDRVNAALTAGGPELMAATVAEMVGVQPDFVVTTSFGGLIGMVNDLGGVTVDSRLAFTDDGMEGEIVQGRNRLTGWPALFFARARHFLPDGDFDRSANQQELLRGILREVRRHAEDPGFLERGVLTAARHLETNLGPVQLYRLAQAMTVVDPDRLRGCVVDGSYGTVNGASIVFPDLAQARRLGEDARADARVDGPC